MSRPHPSTTSTARGSSRQTSLPIPPLQVPSGASKTSTSLPSLPSLTQLIPWDDGPDGQRAQWQAGRGRAHTFTSSERPSASMDESLSASVPLSAVHGLSAPSTPPDQNSRPHSSSYSAHLRDSPPRSQSSFTQGSIPPLPGKLRVPEPRRGPVIPQRRYQPLTASDRRRYVDEVELQSSIYFHSRDGEGFPLKDALNHRYSHLHARDEQMFVQHGPSISLRLNWPGYQPWTRQIPTRDFRNPPGPITRDKLTKNIAKSIQRFIEEQRHREIEPNEEKWRVGEGYIELEDLTLLRLDNVSKGSWQIQLQVLRPLEDRPPRRPPAPRSQVELGVLSATPRQLSWKHVSPASAHTVSYYDGATS